MSGPTGEEKAALLLRSLPPDVTETVLGRLDPALATRLRARMQAIGTLPPEKTEQALSEFSRLLQNAWAADPPRSPSARLAEQARIEPAPVKDAFTPSPAA